MHLLAGHLRVLQTVPRSRTLSVAGGVSVAYVFVHLLPELAEHQTHVAEHADALPTVGTERTLFLVALAGFAAFYGLERVAARSRRSGSGDSVANSAETGTAEGVFWLHVGSFAAYNLLVGYLLFHRQESGTVDLVFYGVAMGLHFVVNDYGLWHHHREAYGRIGRWLLAAAVLAGALIGAVATVARSLLGALLAFLAGGVVLNVVKEELPEERESRFWAFCLGAVGYTSLLLAL